MPKNGPDPFEMPVQEQESIGPEVDFFVTSAPDGLIAITPTRCVISVKEFLDEDQRILEPRDAALAGGATGIKRHDQSISDFVRIFRVEQASPNILFGLPRVDLFVKLAISVRLIG